MVKLEETKIENLSEFDWVNYFEYNNSHLLKLDYSINNELTEEEIKLITPSIRAFQIGEGSEGIHLKKVVKKFSEKTEDFSYQKAMDWFILEENRHSQTLKKYMEIYNIKLIKEIGLDKMFRFLRKMMGLECEVIVLVTAEMIALSYYTALSNCTRSELLKTICTQMLQDELKHVVFQSYTLHKISRKRNQFVNNRIRSFRRFFMKVTSSIVFNKYKDVFLKGGYDKVKFKQEAISYLEQSIKIEKEGDIN